MIASTYASNYFNEDITVDDLHDSLATLSTYLSSEIWVMNTDGDILINSNASVDMDHLTHIDGFNVADFGSKYYTTGSFYNYYDDTHLTVFSPITINYKVRGCADSPAAFRNHAPSCTFTEYYVPDSASDFYLCNPVTDYHWLRGLHPNPQND